MGKSSNRKREHEVSMEGTGREGVLSPQLIEDLGEMGGKNDSVWRTISQESRSARQASLSSGNNDWN